MPQLPNVFETRRPTQLILPTTPNLLTASSAYFGALMKTHLWTSGRLLLILTARVQVWICFGTVAKRKSGLDKRNLPYNAHKLQHNVIHNLNRSFQQPWRTYKKILMKERKLYYIQIGF